MSSVPRNAPCPCNSGKKYKHCHGSSNAPEASKAPNNNELLSDSGFYAKNLMSPDCQFICADQPAGRVITSGNIPPGFMIIQNYLDDQTCDMIINQTNQKQAIQATVQDSKDPSKVVVSKQRQNDIYDVDNLNMDVEAEFKKLFRGPVRDYYSREIEYFEKPNLLKYKPGGFYAFHADSDNWYPETKEWKKRINRDISLLLYLNDNFTGGEIVFPNFNFKLQPKKGMLICFPSDHRYIHKAEVTTSGERYVIVSWAKAKDSKIIDNDPRRQLVYV